MSSLSQLLTVRFQDAFLQAYGNEYKHMDPVLRPTQDARFGDYQANFAMGFAKQLKRKPREIAAEVCRHLNISDICEPVEIAGPGFINIRFLARTLCENCLYLANDKRLGVRFSENKQVVVVDYSGPNVAKEMHVGHLRSTIIGDAIARVLEYLGHEVIRQNHVGDWGTQFGMLIENLLDKGWKPDAATADSAYQDLNSLYQESKQRFDTDESFAERSRQRVVALQSGDTETLAIWQSLVDLSKIYFSSVYKQLDVTLTNEHVKGESSYNDYLADTVEQLTSKKLATRDQGAQVVYLPEFAGRDNKPLPLIIQKSDGGYLYATTDLACLRYRLEKLKANRVIYVTDARQSQHFAMVFKTAQLAHWYTDKELVEHVPFGSVLGEDGKPFKTRSGEVIRLIDLIDEAKRRAREVVQQKNPDLSEKEQQQIAAAVGMGAIKYADLCNDRVKDYVFSWSRMLAMEGNTAPYIQYAYTRVRSIFRRATADLDQTYDPGHIHPDHMVLVNDAEKALCLKLSQFSNVLESVAVNLEPHRLCNYLFELASTFSGFFEACPVIKAETYDSRITRLLLCDLTARTIQQGLQLLGIKVLEKM